MWKRMLLMLFLFVLVVAGIGFLKFRSIMAGIEMGKKMAPPPAAVTTSVVAGQTWQPVLKAVGSLKAINGVTLSTDLAGIVSEIAFESGRPVKKGDLLVKLDTQQEEAMLASAQARRDLAKLDLERKRDLLQKRAISTSDWDSAESQLRQMDAAVLESKALVGRKQIVAPFDGVIGIRQVDLGQYVTPGSMIAPLQSLDPIYVEFSMPQQHLGEIEVGKKIRIVATGTEGSFDGDITAIDSRIDPESRNFMVQATIKNPEHLLRAGMFVDVEVLLPEQPNVLAVPSSSISYAPYGDSVFVVVLASAENAVPGAPPIPPGTKIVEQRFVKLGAARGDVISILSGLKAGEEVVTSGVFKLRGGAPVQINNSVAPSQELQPKPVDS